jgi:proteasome alpha subunit
MNGGELYQWLEAVRNRREYIEDQLSSGKPVVAITGKPGVLLMTQKAGTPKLFEIYDHLALGCLGHPADLERVRQAAIDAAHMEGFTRSRDDVSSRRLVNYTMAPALKNAFEQIFSAPLMFRGVMAELGDDAATDHVWLLEYDGSYTAAKNADATRGVLVCGDKKVVEKWLEIRAKLNTNADTWKELAQAALHLLHWALSSQNAKEATDWPTKFPSNDEILKSFSDGVEIAVLDRALVSRTIAYRTMTAREAGLA